MAERINFVERKLNNLPIPDKGRAIFWDLQVPKLAIRVASSGRKTFCLVKRRNAKVVWITLGVWPDMSIPSARAQAHEALLSFDNPADDPQEVKRKARAVPVLSKVFEKWIKSREVEGLASVSDDRSRYRNWIAPRLENRRVSEITLDDIQAIIDAAKAGGLAGSTVNSVRAILNGLLNQAVKDKHIPANPLQPGLIAREPTKERESFLKPEDMPAFMQAVETEGGDWADFFTLALATGARRGNLLSMRWADIDLSAGVWVIPADESKNKTIMRIALDADAVAILRNRQERELHKVWVFPSVRADGGHLNNPSKAWARILKRAGLPIGRADGLTIHDLRRTLASWMAIGGESLLTIGKVLGHKSPAATARYAHLIDESKRGAVAKATQAMRDAAKVGSKPT